MNFFIKNGDPFEHDFTLLNDNGTPFDLTNVPISSELRSGVDMSLICNFLITKADDDVAKFFLKAVDTQNWPIGTHFFDIKIGFSFGFFHTPTFNISVAQSITL